MAQVGYQVFDVFTDTAMAGNQLGVIADAAGLSSERMQMIARELNLAETIFFLPPENPAHSAKVRIFMPLGELPFAGHPTIGGAIAYAGWHGLHDGATVILEEGVGPVRCTAFANAMGGKSSFVAARVPAELDFGSSDHDVVFALGLTLSDVNLSQHRILMVSGGVPFVTIAVNSVEALARARVNADAWLKLDVVREGKFAAPYLYCQVGENAFQVRMFAPWDGIPEDPATGSAAVAFAATLKRFHCTQDGDFSFEITQGVEMGRPSKIGLALRIEDGALSEVTISGSAVKFAEGKLYLPD